MSSKETDFWDVDKSARDGEHGGYWNALAPGQKALWVLLAVFLVSWCFYIGFALSNQMLPDIGPILSAVPINEPDPDNPGSETPPPVQYAGLRTVLLVGSDARAGDVGRSDTIMLAFINDEEKSLRVLSIPRDTYVYISRSRTKINNAYQYGGVGLTKSVISNMLGIEINSSADISFAGFEELIDALGGITLNVPMDMYNADEHIAIPKGDNQTLNGEDALGFVRFREPMLADVGRIERQQYFLKTLADQLLKAKNIWKIPTLLSIINDHVETDLDFAGLTSYLGTLLSLDISGVEFFTLPGAGRYVSNVSYFLADVGRTRSLMATFVGEEAAAALNLDIPVPESSTEHPVYSRPATSVPATEPPSGGETSVPATEPPSGAETAVPVTEPSSATPTIPSDIDIIN